MAAPSPVKTKINEEVQITHADQKMINSFANKNSKQNELKAAVANKKKELQNLEDAGDELMLLDDNGDMVPVHIGEVFLHLTTEEAQEYIDQCKTELEEEVKKYDEKITVFENELKDLKIKLYAKFGTNINLEEEDS